MQDIGSAIISGLSESLIRIILFIPQLISGLIILIAGWIIAFVLSYLTKKAFNFIRIDQLLAKAGAEKSPSVDMWANIAATVVFWFVILIFLIPTFDIWGLSSVNNLLNQFLAYIPNVFAAVVVGFIGYTVAGIAYKVVSNAVKGFGSDVANFLGKLGQYALIVFTILIVLNQLQIAQSLIQLLVAGLVLMFALAGGLAFGLGGKEAAQELLRQIMERRKK